jgi:hypothetical protein
MAWSTQDALAVRDFQRGERDIIQRVCAQGSHGPVHAAFTAVDESGSPLPPTPPLPLLKAQQQGCVPSRSTLKKLWLP